MWIKRKKFQKMQKDLQKAIEVGDYWKERLGQANNELDKIHEYLGENAERLVNASICLARMMDEFNEAWNVPGGKWPWSK